MPNRRIVEVMKMRRLVKINYLASVRETAKKMKDQHVAAIAVVGDEGGLKGIFTERDMIDRVVAEDIDPDETPVSQVMTVNPITIDEGATVRQALGEMQGNQLRHLPVTRGAAVVGMVSIRDFVGLEVAELEREKEFERKVWEVTG